PLFVARALDPPLFRCPKRASVPRGCEVEQGRRRATPDRRLQKRAERCGPTPSPGTAAPPNFFACTRHASSFPSSQDPAIQLCIGLLYETWVTGSRHCVSAR